MEKKEQDDINKIPSKFASIFKKMGMSIAVTFNMVETVKTISVQDNSLIDNNNICQAIKNKSPEMLDTLLKSYQLKDSDIPAIMDTLQKVDTLALPQLFNVLQTKGNLFDKSPEINQMLDVFCRMDGPENAIKDFLRKNPQSSDNVTHGILQNIKEVGPVISKVLIDENLLDLQARFHREDPQTKQISVITMLGAAAIANNGNLVEAINQKNGTQNCTVYDYIELDDFSNRANKLLNHKITHNESNGNDTFESFKTHYASQHQNAVSRYAMDSSTQHLFKHKDLNYRSPETSGKATNYTVYELKSIASDMEDIRAKFQDTLSVKEKSQITSILDLRRTIAIEQEMHITYDKTLSLQVQHEVINDYKKEDKVLNQNKSIKPIA